ncbi:hypothetical protein GCM10011391_13110 [Pullulanibacillus camelliae]|uniref:Uncharacterized protein n=1 Tax=Pullulanibacillus camelliae TaxID=1707096 RepID=A0A8J2VP08_9BACL|nr:hypothetical protein GCM10011391_13110 [Pullulanibacillus camelliae]
MKKTQKQLDKNAEDAQFDDNSASLAYSMGEAALDMVPWFYIRTVCIVLGMIIIALGFVPLGFIAI